MTGEAALAAPLMQQKAHAQRDAMFGPKYPPKALCSVNPRFSDLRKIE